MSCDHWTCDTAIVELAPDLRAAAELGDYPAAHERKGGRSLKRGRSRQTANQSEPKGHEAQSRIIPDSTQTEPEYVWGDEGPIND